MQIDPSSWEVGGTIVPKEKTPMFPDGDLQKTTNLMLMEWAKSSDLPMLLTLDSHMVGADRKPLQDIMLQNGNPDGWRYPQTYNQLTTEEAWARWSGEMGLAEYAREFASAVDNNMMLCDMVGEITMPGRVRLPMITVPREIRTTYPGDHTSQYLEMVMERIKEYGRFPMGDQVYIDRLLLELDVIAHNGQVDFLPYFLFLEEVCRDARDAGDLVGPGRGSAAGCLLAYLLKITHINPIEYGLSFARFLSIARINRKKFPDIDLDFGNAGAIAERLKARHGDKFVRICTVGTMKPRNALRDISRVLLHTRTNPEAAALVDEVSKSISIMPQGIGDSKKWFFGYTDDEGMYHAGEVDQNELLAKFFETYPDVEKGVRDALDIPRSLGRHASAYCIADIPISEIVPICRVGGEECTQFTKDPVEALGIQKIDLLGLNTLKDIGGCLKWVKHLRGIDLDFYNIPTDDAKTWAAFARGDNQTVFQFGSKIGVGLSKKISPSSIDDLAQMTSAGRPGTMDSLMPDGETKLIEQWESVRQGKKDPEVIHPSVAHILEPTGGICLFQEQISAMFEVACGYTEEQADEIREIVGKKKKDRMAQLLPEIRERLANSGWRDVQIESFISLCTAAANYSFNKSHAVAYSYTGYVCQYLKSNYPLEWWTSILQNSSKDDLEKNASFCSDLVSPPDVNLSELDFFIADRKKARSDEGRIIYPLRMVNKVKSAAQFVYEARPYRDLRDFHERVNRSKVHLGVTTQLIWAGAFDALCGVESILDRNSIYEQYMRLRGGLDEERYRRRTELELMRLQVEALPLWTPDYVGYMRRTPELMNVSIQGPGAVNRRRPKDSIMVGGIIKDVHSLLTKKNDKMAFVTISNLNETASLTFFPEAYAVHGEYLKEGEVVFAAGAVNEFNGRKSLLVDKFYVFHED